MQPAQHRRYGVAALALAALAAIGCGAGAPSIAGRWDAVVIVNDVEIPFRFDVSADDSRVSGSFFNGDERIQSTGGTFVDDALTLTFDHYATRVEARLIDGRLEGQYVRARGAPYPFRARQCGAAATGGRAGTGDRRDLDHPGEELEGRSGVAVHRSPDRERRVGCHPARRWRHRRADRALSGRQVRPEPLFRAAAGAPRADARTGWIARHPAEQAHDDDRRPRGARARTPGRGAVRSLDAFVREERRRPLPIQLSRRPRPRHLERRRTFSQQGGDRQHHRHVVSELPRRGAVPDRALSAVSGPWARDRGAFRSKRRRSSRTRSACARTLPATASSIRCCSPGSRTSSRPKCRRSKT